MRRFGTVKRAIVAIGLLLGLLTLPIVNTTTPAGADLAKPVPTSPLTGQPPVAGNPILQWDPVPGAARYRVQVSTSAGFGTTVFNEVTYNTRATPPNDLALTTHYWRVRAIDSSGPEDEPPGNPDRSQPLARHGGTASHGGQPGIGQMSAHFQAKRSEDRTHMYLRTHMSPEVDGLR